MIRLTTILGSLNGYHPNRYPPMPMFASGLHHRPIQGLRCNGSLKRKRITTIWKTFHSSGSGIELTYPTLHIAILVKHTDIEKVTPKGLLLSSFNTFDCPTTYFILKRNSVWPVYINLSGFLGRMSSLY